MERHVHKAVGIEAGSDPTRSGREDQDVPGQTAFYRTGRAMGRSFCFLTGSCTLPIATNGSKLLVVIGAMLTETTD
eukprot:575488-Hanusia_phi.AAC.1